MYPYWFGGFALREFDKKYEEIIEKTVVHYVLIDITVASSPVLILNISLLFAAILTRYNSWSAWKIVVMSWWRCFCKLSVNIPANKTKVARLVWQDGLNLGAYIIPDDFIATVDLSGQKEWILQTVFDN